MDNIKLYGTAEAAALLGITPHMLRQGVKSGRFPVVKTPAGAKFMFDIHAIKRVLDTEAAAGMQSKTEPTTE